MLILVSKFIIALRGFLKVWYWKWRHYRIARYCWSLMEAEFTLITHNTFPLSRHLGCLQTSPGITRFHSKTRRQRNLQRRLTRPPRRKRKDAKSTGKRTLQQRRFDILSLLLLHLSYLCTRKIDPTDTTLTKELWIVLHFLTSTPYCSLVNWLIRQEAESGLQCWT